MYIVSAIFFVMTSYSCYMSYRREQYAFSALMALGSACNLYGVLS